MAILVPDADAYARACMQLLPPGGLWEQADMAVRDSDIALDDGLVTSGLLTIGVDARAEPEEVTEPEERRGYWADEFSRFQGDRSGNKLWQLARNPSQDVRLVAEQYGREAFQWYLDDRIAETVNVVAQLDPVDPTRLNMLIEIRAPEFVVRFELQDLWNNTRIIV